MKKNIISQAEYINHPKAVGVYVKHFFCSEDNDRISNMLVKVEPGYGLDPHNHENTSEFFYIISGEGEFFINGEWTTVREGYALKASTGEEHGLRNNNSEPLIVFSTFSPPMR